MKNPELSDKIGPKIRVIGNSFRRIADYSTSEMGITGAQSFILGYLVHHGDELACQHDIELRFNIKHPTATGILQRLSEKGFVEFLPDKSDRRLKRISVTEAGRNAANLTASRLDAMEKHLTRNFSEEELALLHTLLNKLTVNAKEEYEIPQEGEQN